MKNRRQKNIIEKQIQKKIKGYVERDKGTSNRLKQDRKQEMCWERLVAGEKRRERS